MAPRFAVMGGFLLAGVLGSSAAATCRPPPDATASPNAAAAWLVEHTDRLGFAVVTRRENVAAHQAETLDMLFPIYGRGGPIRMRLLMEGDSLFITDATTSFGVPAGTIVFAALQERPDGAVVSECVAALFTKVRRDEVVRALARRRHR